MTERSAGASAIPSRDRATPVQLSKVRLEASDSLWHSSTMFSRESLDEALAKLDRAALSVNVAAAEQERREVLTRFPREAWGDMPLERYALGLENSHNSYCWWLEFNTPALGSIKGGSARKHIIYKSKNKDRWFFNTKKYATEREAWSAVRSGFEEAFQHAEAGVVQHGRRMVFAFWICSSKIGCPPDGAKRVDCQGAATRACEPRQSRCLAQYNALIRQVEKALA